jgi:ABC-type phosphate/phosphonate transport system substrate-binding protein
MKSSTQKTDRTEPAKLNCSKPVRRLYRLTTSLILLSLTVFQLNAPQRTCLADESAELPKVLRSGFLARVIADVDPRDAQATLEIMTREVSRNLGLITSPKVVLYQDTRSMFAAVRIGELEMVSMPSIDYLRLRETASLVPAFVALHKEGVGLRFVLITHRDSGIRSISQLRGKTLLTLSTYKHEPAHVWLNVLLMKEGKGSPATFFRQVKEVDKVSQGIMGVFFRKADGALVTQAGLDAARLLNPQLDRQLVIIAESPELSDGVTCFPASIPEKTRQILSKAVMQMSTSISGRQLFTIFQSSGVVPFKGAYLEGLEDLLREESILRNRLARTR